MIEFWTGFVFGGVVVGLIVAAFMDGLCKERKKNENRD